MNDCRSIGSAAYIDNCPGRQGAVILDVHERFDAVGAHIAAVKILPGSQVTRRQESIRGTCKSACRSTMIFASDVVNCYV